MQLVLPDKHGATEFDRAFATPHDFNTRKIMWGCQIAADPENTGRSVRGQFAADGTKSKAPNTIHVGVAAAPPQRLGTSVREHPDQPASRPLGVGTLRQCNGNNSTQYIVEMRPRAPWFEDPGFKVEAQKLTGTENS